MKQSLIYKVNMTMVLTVTVVAAVTILLLSFLYQYDNKYTAKTGMTQVGICLAPERGIRFLADGWDYYPDRLLSPGDLEGTMSPGDGYRIRLGDYPSLVPFHKDGNPYGVSTYRLRLRGNGLYSMYLPEPLCAVSVYIGGCLVGSNGDVSPEHYRPLIRDGIYSFSIDGDTEIIIQTANYSHYYGGLYYPPAIGDTGSISRMIAGRMIFYALLCFSALTLALFCAALWLSRKKQRDATAFYFGLLSLSFAIRVCYPFLRLAGVPLVRTLYAAEDMTAMLCLYCVVRISLRLFAPDIKSQVQTAASSVSLGMVAVGIVIPLLILPIFPGFTAWYGMLISWYKLIAAGFLGYIAVYGIASGQPHAVISLAGITAYAICLFASVLTINHWEPIRGGWPDEYASFLLVLLFGGIMVRRSHEMAAENLRLTEKLSEEVADKTQHLSLLLKEREQLMQELSHDMKSPVTSLSNMVQILRMNNMMMDQDTRDSIRIIEERCDDLSERLRSIQTLNSETGGSGEMQELSLNQFLAEFYRDSQPVVEMSGPDFTCNLTRLPCIVLANPDKMQRALENLVFNASYFTPPEGNIHLSLERVDRYAHIRVADTGCGIAESDINKIFDRFYTTRPDEGGQGLGLAITKTIVTEHRGKLTVQSKVSVGTTFTIQLPLYHTGSDFDKA